MTPPSYQVPDSFRNRNWDQPVDGSWSEDDENGYYEDPEPGTAHERSSAPRRRPSRASTINSTGTIRTNPSPHRLGRHSNHHRDVGDGRATAPPAPRRRQLTTGTSSAAHDDRWQGSNVHYAGEQMAQIRNPGYYKSGPGAPPNVNPMMSPLQGMQDPFSRGPGPYQGAPYQGGPYPGPPYQTPPSSYDYSAPRGPMLPPSSSRPPTHRPTPRDPGVFEPTSSASRPKVRVRSSSTNRPRVQVRVQAARRPSPPPPPEPRIEPRVERLEQENQALRERLELTQEQCRIEMEAAAQHRQELDAQRAAEEEAAQRNAERNRRHDREHRERSSQSRTRRSGSRGAPNAPRVVRINHSDLREARPKVIVEVGKSMEPGPAPNDSRMEDQQRSDKPGTTWPRTSSGGFWGATMQCPEIWRCSAPSKCSAWHSCWLPSRPDQPWFRRRRYLRCSTSCASATLAGMAARAAYRGGRRAQHAEGPREHRRTVPRPHQDSRRAMSRHQTPGPNDRLGARDSRRCRRLCRILPPQHRRAADAAYAEEIHDEDLEASRRGPRSSGRRFPDGRTEIGSQDATERTRRQASRDHRRRQHVVETSGSIGGREIPRRRTSGIYPRPAPASVPDAPNPLKTKPLAY
ncbi:hypothetical protein B0T22DRAFT_474712 [Podospora appendiculata]|uniref:Uncharacterized protein n=1 Tax=Podospora appendiculata TaxID=314037 RepID=A0AAE0WYD4_9PEZI|nr:hypothetical protein B0T22DRAFT_474712 [Podospora appendiculata]